MSEIIGVEFEESERSPSSQSCRAGPVVFSDEDTLQEPPKPGHPLQEITIWHSEELTGKLKDQNVIDILTSPDVRNVFPESPMRVESVKAKVVVHTLDTGNTLLAVAISTSKGVLIYYELAEPLVKLGRRYKSQAMLYTIEGKTVELVSTSVNGRLVSLSLSPQKGGVVLTSACGGCIDPLNGPWEEDCVHCVALDVNDMFECRAGCIFCGSNIPCWFFCAAVWCPFCYLNNCLEWEWACCACLLP